MLVYRLFIALLTLVYLLLSIFAQEIGALQGIIISCALLFLILDIRQDTDDIRKLEAQIASLPR